MNTFDTIFADEPVTVSVCEAGAGFTIPAPGIDDLYPNREHVRHAETLPAGYYPDQTTDEPVTLATQEHEAGYSIPMPGASANERGAI